MLDVELINNVLFMVKNDLEVKYKTFSLSGKCFEAAESIVSILHALGYESAHIVTADMRTYVKIEGFHIDVCDEHFNLCRD